MSNIQCFALNLTLTGVIGLFKKKKMCTKKFLNTNISYGAKTGIGSSTKYTECMTNVEYFILILIN